MTFWDWLNRDYEHTGERFGYAKRITVGAIVFLLVPLGIYFLIIWDPVIGVDDSGDPVKLGAYIVLGLYWGGAYLAYKRYQAKARLNRLLDILLDEQRSGRLFDAAEKRRRVIREEKFLSKKGETRAEWFNV